MNKGKEQILSYAKVTGASFNKANPNFEGSISEIEMFSALRLIVEYETGIKIPATHNGLGYNNLIYMSLLLAKMQVNSDGSYLGSNAKVFPILAIEEPEAHLHPAMQYQFLRFLKENKNIDKKVRQVFVTTHSTQITSAVLLDEIICLHSDGNELVVGYPGKVFSIDDQGKKSKAYVQRFLDATKSDMLFSQKVILVEGIAEQLLIPIMAEYVGKYLEGQHIAVINVGGRYFEHFLNLFDCSNSYSIPKKVVCLTDRDPVRKKKSANKFNKCYPFEFEQDSSSYVYKNNDIESNRYKDSTNIRFFSQDKTKGKTFEYDLVLHNPCLKLLITDSISNRVEITELMQLYEDDEPLSQFISKLKGSEENKRIQKSIQDNTSLDEDDKKKAIIASRYLNSVGKGENALELSYALEQYLKKEMADKFTLPSYIQEAIEWICQ